MLRARSPSAEPGMIGILRRTGFWITESRSQILDFGWVSFRVSVCVCVRGCVCAFNKVESKLIQVKIKLIKHCIVCLTLAHLHSMHWRAEGSIG